MSKQMIQPPQLTNTRGAKIDKILLPLTLCDRGGTSNTLNSTRGALVVCALEEKLEVFAFNGPISPDDVSFQGGRRSFSVGLIEPERDAPDQPPSVVIHRVQDPTGPGPENYDFSGVQTLKLFEAFDSRDDLDGCAKKRWPCVGCLAQHTSESGPPPFFRGQDLFAGIEIRSAEVTPPQI